VYAHTESGVRSSIGREGLDREHALRKDWTGNMLYGRIGQGTCFTEGLDREHALRLNRVEQEQEPGSGHEWEWMTANELEAWGAC